MITPLTYDDFMRLWDRLFPQFWLQPLRSPGPGWEQLQADARVGARLSLAVWHMQQEGLILSATGGAFATVTVDLNRTGTAAVTLLAGSQFMCSVGGQIFLLTDDVVWPAMDTSTKTATLTSLTYGQQNNVAGPYTTATGVVIAGEIDTARRLYEDPPYADPSITVTQVNDATGGTSPALDGLGQDRGIPRRAGETDAAYRARIRQLPDTVSPGAIERFTVNTFAPLYATALDVEPWSTDFPSVWDAPTSTASAGWAWDDPRTSPPFHSTWLDEALLTKAFIVFVPNLSPISDVGFAWDDPAVTLADFSDPIGARAVNAYDLPNSTGSAILQSVFDGGDAGKDAVYAGFFQQLQRIKAAGVAGLIELQGQ